METNWNGCSESAEQPNAPDLSRRGLLLIGVGLSGTLMGGRMLWQMSARSRRVLLLLELESRAGWVSLT